MAATLEMEEPVEVSMVGVERVEAASAVEAMVAEAVAEEPKVAYVVAYLDSMELQLEHTEACPERAMKVQGGQDRVAWGAAVLAVGGQEQD